MKIDPAKKLYFFQQWFELRTLQVALINVFMCIFLEGNKYSASI
jgi:hypothetical protein